MPQVFEGSAELNIQKFLDALKAMETASGVTAVNIDTTFKGLDAGIQATLGNIKSAINGVAQQITAAGSALSGAQAKITQGQQQAAAQGKQAAQSSAQTQQQLARQQQAGAQHLQTVFQAELAMRRQYHQEDERLLRDKARRDLETLKIASESEANQLRAGYAQQRQIIERQLAEQQRLKAEALRQQNDASGAKAALLGPGPQPADLAARLAATEQTYQRSVQAARMAQEEEASLQRKLTQVMDVERRSQFSALERQRKEEKAINEQANRDFVNGWKGAWDQAIADFRKNVQIVEDQWNSVFRAGSQLSSIGQQLNRLSGDITQLGSSLTTNAGEFDFWSRRVVASTRAANDGLYAAFGGSQQQTLDAFNSSLLELGHDLGILKPEEVAKSWYLYQSAVGTSIESHEDMIASQAAVQSILRAAVISNTSYEVAIRGVSQAMAEFGLGQEDAAHSTQVMLNLTQTSQAEFRDVLEAFKMVGPQAHRLGMSLEEVSSILARLSDNGIKGSAAGRGLSMALTTLLDPSGKADDVLQHLLITQQKLSGSWRDLVFRGGEFIGMLDTVGQQGEVTQKGFLHMFAEATKGMSEAQRQYYVAAVFTQNATRTLIPLIGEYSDAMASGADKTAAGKKRMEEMMLEFQNATLQASLFNDQWELVSESIKVRLGRATFSIQEGLVRLGFIVADTFLPIVEWIGRAIQRFIEFGETHPSIVRGLIAMAAALALVTAVAGPILLIMGQVLQFIASWQIAVAVIRQSTSIFAVGLRALGVSVAALTGPFLVVIAIIGALYLAWKTNFLGMGDVLGRFFGLLSNGLSAMGDLVEGAFGLVFAIISGDKEKIRAALSEIATAFIEIFLVLPGQLLSPLLNIGATIINWAGNTFGPLAANLVIWGYNLMISLVNGIYEGAEAVWEAAASVAEGIASYFRSFSPPKVGPLQGIRTWGTNLIYTLIEGMDEADLSAVDAVAGKIGDALKLAIQQGDVDAGVFAATMKTANEKIAQMIDIVKGGSAVNADFFEPLRDNLGEWYDEVVNIALAYQDVYAAQQHLTLEKEKLEVIKQQRKELDAQNKARQSAFDRILGKDGTESVYNPDVQAQMVDPTTEAGKAEIEKMRRSLSKEDFQNWINWQRRLWDQQHDVQDQALATQEDAQNTTVDALTKQLELAKGQYDYFVKMFEYAEKMFKLQEEQDRLDREREKELKAKEPKVSPYGTPLDLSEARGEIAGLVGADTAILDEGTLKDNRGGDEIGAFGDATRQREKEQQRISDLDAANRKKRAEFEAQLINATSDEERQRIKQQKDAWDAAYKEEKSRLQERAQFAKEVQDAAENQADRGKAAREAEQQAQFEADIKRLLGEQSPVIEDANELKRESSSLDEAAIKAQAQLREEERDLSDLRALGDQKKLDFERRLREASGDPEKIRRIKEEQEAWETAYKSALEVQQARVEAARRTKQDLGDATSAEAGAKGPKDFEPPSFGSGDGPPEPDWLKKLREDGYPEPPKPDKPEAEAPRKSKLAAEGLFENLKRSIDYLRDGSIPASEKVRKLGQSIVEFFGGDSGKVERALGWLREGAPEWEKVLGLDKQSWEKFGRDLGAGWDAYVVQPAQNLWSSFMTNLGTGWSTYVAQPAKELWKTFTTNLSKGWTDYVVAPVTQWAADVGTKASAGWDVVRGAFEEAFGDGPNSIVERSKRGWAAAQAWAAEAFGDGPNSIPERVKRGLDKATEWANETFNPEQPNSIPARMNRGYAKVAQWTDDTFGLTNPNSIPNRVSRGWGVVATWTDDTFGLTNPNSIPNRVSRGWQKVTDWTDDTFGLTNPNSIPNRAKRGWQKVADWTEDTFGLANPNSVPNRAKRGWDKVAAWTDDTFGLTNPNSIPNSVSRGWGKIATWTSETFDTANPDSFASTVMRGWNRLSSTIWKLFGDDDPDNIQGRAKRGWAKVAAAVSDAFVGDDGIVTKAMRGLSELGRRIGNFFADLNPFGGSGNAPEPDGSHADGLGYVPFDGYISELHKGERVLTAAEAALYNGVEKLGVLGALSALANSATAKVAQTTAQQQPQNFQQTNIREGDKKTVNFGDVHLDATNPDEGRAFLQRLAFLGG